MLRALPILERALIESNLHLWHKNVSRYYLLITYLLRVSLGMMFMHYLTAAFLHVTCSFLNAAYIILNTAELFGEDCYSFTTIMLPC